MKILAFSLAGFFLIFQGCTERNRELPIQREEEYRGSDTNIPPLRKTDAPMNSE